MKKKTSNILICVLAAVVVFCGIMAIGTFNGWFGGHEENSNVPQTEAVQEETVEQEETGVTSAADNVQAEEQQKKQAQATQPKANVSNRCTIQIKCSSILNHRDSLNESKVKNVPSNGIILSTSTVEFKEGNTVYEVLRGTCSAAGIPLSARNSSAGVYVEGINGLFEFDCGGTSGWMYSVNGTAPNHSCGEHKVKNGDNIVWYYTCGD